MKLSPTFALLAASVSASLASPTGGNQGQLSFLQAPSQGAKPEFPTQGSKGAVAAEVDVCSNIGAETLSMGGSAADAIISTAFCVGSMANFHSGIGGGGFALIRFPDRHYEMLDFREEAPAKGRPDLYSGLPATASLIGGLAVGVYGELRAWEALHAKAGKLPWQMLVNPAHHLNLHGFKVPSQLSVAIDRYKDGFICKDPLFAEVYCNGGVPAKEGDMIRNPRLAATLEQIGKRGASVLYEGPIAENTIATVQRTGGIMTLEDLAAYKVQWRKPVSIKYKDFKIWSTVAPSSGAVVLSGLNTMSGFEQKGGDLTTHRLIEAIKWGYSERSHYGDPAFVKGVQRLQEKALTPAAGAEVRSKISNDQTFPLSYYNTTNLKVLSDAGTSAIVATDSYGHTISLTTTINTFFGAQIMTEDGIVLNNEMDDFAKPKTATDVGTNFMQPRKRPQSSISPIIVERPDGSVHFAVAGAGGIRIITSIFQTTFHKILGKSLQDAIAEPRWHDQLQPNSTSLEWHDSFPVIPNWQGFSNTTAVYLAALGHNVSFVPPGLSSLQGIEKTKGGEYQTASEVRQLAARGAALP